MRPGLIHLHSTDLFVNEGRCHFRIPVMAVDGDGRLHCFANCRMDTDADAAQEVQLVYRQWDPSTSQWSPVEILFAQEGWVGAVGTVTVIRQLEQVMLTYYKGAPSEAKDIIESGPHAQTGYFRCVRRKGEERWHHERMPIDANAMGAVASSHGSSAGIELRSGPDKDRLVAPGRFQTRPGEHPDTLRSHHHNCALFSDDHGRTWTTGGPVQAGTGEGCLVAVSDGRIYFNSRAYFMDGRRRTAWSHDGGRTFTDFDIDPHLTEPENGGCNAGMALYPTGHRNGGDIILFSNPAGQTREKMTVRATFDGARSWPVSKMIYPGPSAYSAMAVAEDGTIYVLFENGLNHPYEKLTLATLRFDGEVPIESVDR